MHPTRLNAHRCCFLQCCQLRVVCRHAAIVLNECFLIIIILNFIHFLWTNLLTAPHLCGPLSPQTPTPTRIFPLSHGRAVPGVCIAHAGWNDVWRVVVRVLAYTIPGVSRTM